MVSLATPANPTVWVLHDGKAGMASQALGLAEATGFPFIEKCLAIRFPWSALPPGLWVLPFHAAGGTGARLAPPWPDLLIACGRNSAMPALAVKRARGGRAGAAQIQNPSVGNTEFRLFLVAGHARFSPPQVTSPRPPPPPATPARLP